MACGCTLRGVMNTPADHLMRARALEAQGNYVEARRHVAMARQSLNTLRGLRGLGVAADGSSTAASGTGGLTDAQKADLRAKLNRVGEQQRRGTARVTSMIADIGRLITSAVRIIVNIPGLGLSAKAQSDINKVLSWLGALLGGGNTVPPMGDADVEVLRAICTFWGTFGGMISGGVDLAESLAYTAVSQGPSATGRLSDFDAALFAFAHYMVRVLDGWCSNEDIRALVTPPASAPAPQPPPSLQAQARMAWNNARTVRLSVEEGLRRRLDRPLNIIVFIVPDFATAQRLDCSSATALLAAENALIQLTGSVPAAGGASGTPGSTVARSFFVTPPAASCGLAVPSGGGGGAALISTGGGSSSSGGGGGGGAGVAVAGAGLLALLFFL